MSDVILDAKTGEGDGKAPVRTAAFNRMAEQLDAAMKGAKLPDPPVAPVEPPKPSTPKPPKPAPEPPKPAPAKPVEPVEPPKAKEPEKVDDDLSENPYSRDWKTIRQHLKERRELQVQMEKAKTEREALLKQLEDAKSKPSSPVAPAEPPPELAELKTRLESEMKSKAEIEQQLKILALERAPEFKQHYDSKFEAASKQAQAAVPDDKKGIVADLIKLPPSPYRKQLVGSLMAEMDSEYDKAMLTAAIVEMDRTRSERDQALKDNETNYQRLQELEAKKKSEEQKATEARMEMTIKGVLDAARQRFDAFKPVSGNEAHNAFVKESEEKVARFFRGQLPAEEMAILPAIAAEHRLVTAQRDKLLAELEQAQKTIAAYEASAPQLTGGSKKEDGAKPKGFKEKFVEAWPGPQ